jgi:hypothetical protein
LTRCSMVFSAMIYSGSKFCCVSMLREGGRQALKSEILHHHPAIHRQHLTGDVP